MGEDEEGMKEVKEGDQYPEDTISCSTGQLLLTLTLKFTQTMRRYQRAANDASRLRTSAISHVLNADSDR